jgi:hypothetical protein
MRFFKRESRLESLERQLHTIDGQIGKAKADLTALRGNGLIDPVLQKFLQERFAFDYDFEKQKLESIIRAKEAELAQLEKEKAQLEPRVREENFKEECKLRGIKFIGEDVEGYEFSTVKIHCSHCGHKFQMDLRAHGSFNNVWACSTESALQQIYGMKLNRVWPLNCEKCHAELDVWVQRQKI